MGEIMKKRIVAFGLACAMLPLAGCSDVPVRVVEAPETVVVTEVFEDTKETQEATSTTETVMAEVETTEEMQTESEQATEEPTEQETSATMEFLSLTEGELEARRVQQANFAAARDSLYAAPNSKDKTEKIVQLDKQIIENNAYAFFSKRVCFIGDSITEGITAAVDTEGDRISYPEYAADALHIGTMLNHGLGGRSFANYGDDALSIVDNFGNVINNSADIIVVFAGVNDYLAEMDNKRFGNIYNKDSTAGYCGAVRMFCKEIAANMPDCDVFFVLMYPIDRQTYAVCTDVETQPTLEDYMEVQRKLAEEYGFEVIDLYSQGFMDCTSQESKDYYLRDGLHPKDNGNIALGTHIAAELSLYYSQKE